MPRRREVPKRKVIPDPVYGSKLLTKFVNQIMVSGKKSIAEGIVYQALKSIATKVKGSSPLELFEKAIDNIKPLVEVKSRRVGGSTYQVPIEVSSSRGIALAMRWLADASKKRKELNMFERLANEIIDATEQKGTAVKKRDDTHKMADANKAFSHYRW